MSLVFKYVQVKCFIYLICDANIESIFYTSSVYLTVTKYILPLDGIVPMTKMIVLFKITLSSTNYRFDSAQAIFIV